MAKTKAELFHQRREYVNKEFARMVTGKSVSNPKKAKIFKMLWKKAKREVK